MEWRTEHSTLWAHVSCLCLGVGLITRGVLPILGERIVARASPSAATLLVGSIAMLLGAAFVGLHVLIRRRVLWAAWTGFGLAAAITAGAATATLIAETPPTTFVLVGLAGSVTIATWLATGVRSASGRPPAPVRVQSDPVRAGG